MPENQNASSEDLTDRIIQDIRDAAPDIGDDDQGNPCEKIQLDELESIIRQRVARLQRRHAAEIKELEDRLKAVRAAARAQDVEGVTLRVALTEIRDKAIEVL